MKPLDAHREEERIFGEALLQAPAKRRAFLVDACRNNSLLRCRIEELLREHEQTVNALDRSPGHEWRTVSDAATAASKSDDLASTAGRYVLGEKLGEGGWGEVYAADQMHPVRRSVAIKIIKLGMDTRAIVARFQAERQALALMEHENIARVFDAGETAQGRPFFAMEKVQGTRITVYCDEHRLTLRRRLELFMQVCDAVQHAHQKGVIHRDLKPSNILVGGTVGAPCPKIIDFGIAKATQGRLVDETLVTELDGFMGTPSYVSPEQADTRGEAVDTRSDIYSLGVVLYELLTGCTPLGATDVRTVGVEEVRRRIRVMEPLRPSACIGRLDEKARGEAAERRRLSAAKFAAALAGDLDSVLMKCLEKSPARRYESAGALAQDLGRYLEHEPVTARPAGQWYVWRKFVRRNRIAFSIAGGIGVLLIAGVTVSTLLLFREKEALARAVAAEQAQIRAREEAEKASRLAKTEAARSDRATQFMTSVLNGVKPAVARGRDTELLRELLDEAAARLDSVLKEEPEVEADLRDVIGEAFWHLNESEKAARMHRRALALREQVVGQSHPTLCRTLTRLGLFEMYAGDETEAEKIFRRLADICSREYGPEDLRTLDAQFFRAETLKRQAHFTAAAELLEEVHRVQLRVFPPNDLRLLRTDFIWGDLLSSDGAATAAERTFRRIIANYPAETTGRNEAFFLHYALDRLAVLLLEQGRIDEAIETLRECLAASVKEAQPNLVAQLRLAHALRLKGRCDEALPVLRATTEKVRQRVSRDKSTLYARMLGWATMMEGECMAQTGRAAEAEALLREACAISFRPEGVTVQHPAFELAKLLRQQGKPAEADAALEGALERAGRENNEFVYQLLPAVHRSVRAQHGAARAEALVREQIAAESACIEQNGPVAAASYSIAFLYAAADLGAFDLIAPVVRERLAWWEQHRPTEAPTFAYGALSGEVLFAEGRLDEAERALLVASEGLERTRHSWKFATPWRAGRVDGALARFYATCTRPEEPGRWRQLMKGGGFEPEWELMLARTLFDAGRHREANEILPGARKRAEEQLAQRPEHDRLRAVVARAVELQQACLRKLELQTPAQSRRRDENK